MLDRNIHVIQPYWVGSRHRKSLAMIIPSQIVKAQKLDTSSVLIMSAINNTTKQITLKILEAQEEQKSTLQSLKVCGPEKIASLSKQVADAAVAGKSTTMTFFGGSST